MLKNRLPIHIVNKKEIFDIIGYITYVKFIKGTIM